MLKQEIKESYKLKFYFTNVKGNDPTDESESSWSSYKLIKILKILAEW